MPDYLYVVIDISCGGLPMIVYETAIDALEHAGIDPATETVNFLESNKCVYDRTRAVHKVTVGDRGWKS